MLIRTRREGESLTAGDTITVTALDARGNQICISINAPRDGAAHREEVAERIARGDQRAPAYAKD